jgi:hypothetical protein
MKEPLCEKQSGFFAGPGKSWFHLGFSKATMKILVIFGTR